MPLDGTNPLCAQCKEKCKQWSQVKVVKCPFYKHVTLQAQENVNKDQG